MKCGLVLEGGSRRCMFTAAVLDCFMEEGITFPYVVGVSAGAQMGLNYISKQHGRSREIMLPEFSRTYLNGPEKSIMANFMKRITYSFSYNEYPFDFDTFFSSDTVCEIAATDCLTGEAVYFSEREDEHRLLDAMMASSSLPMIFPEVQVDGRYYVDGCIADSIPYEHAFEMGCDRLIVISTKSEGEEAADYRGSRRILERMYKEKYPLLFDRCMDRYDRFNAQYERLFEIEKEGRVLVLRPDQPYVWAFELSKERLDTMYEASAQIARSRMQEIKQFISVG